MAKHTPTPWRVEASKITRNSLIKAGDPSDAFTVTVCKAAPASNPADFDFDTPAANAARIVACVNACRGLDDAALADLPKLLDSFAAAVAARDELLAAAKEVVRAFSLRDRPLHLSSIESLLGLGKAIANAEKGGAS